MNIYFKVIDRYINSITYRSNKPNKIEFSDYS